MCKASRLGTTLAVGWGPGLERTSTTPFAKPCPVCPCPSYPCLRPKTFFADLLNTLHRPPITPHGHGQPPDSLSPKLSCPPTSQRPQRSQAKPTTDTKYLRSLYGGWGEYPPSVRQQGVWYQHRAFLQGCIGHQEKDQGRTLLDGIQNTIEQCALFSRPSTPGPRHRNLAAVDL